jgi:mono/diheme cytochrome c family protein
MMRFGLPALVLAGCLVLGADGAVTSASAQDESVLEPGTGSDIVAHSCANCHALTQVVQVRKNRSDWETTIQTMHNYGLQLSDEDTQTALDYLSSHYGLQQHKPTAK